MPHRKPCFQFVIDSGEGELAATSLLVSKHHSREVRTRRSHAHTDDGTPSRPLWYSSALRLSSSALFGILLLGGVAGLEGFVRLSDLHTGFAVPSVTLQNLATYIPVATVILLGWVWQACHAEVKKMVPWAVMSSSSVPPEDSVLLDYVGANLLVGAVTAIRKRHHNILICAVGSMTVAVCSIVAASIWDIRSTARIYHTALQQSATFNGSSLENTTDVAQAVSRYLSRTVLQLPPPPWIAENMIIAPFNLSNPVPGMVVASVTQGYNATLTCERADVSLLNNGTNLTIAYAGGSRTIPCDVFEHQPRNWSYTADPYRTLLSYSNDCTLT